jgi:hypothetical protein
LAKCLTNELGIPISFKHPHTPSQDLGIRCKRPKLELLHGEDYKEGKRRVEDYKHVAVFEDETIITQKPCIRKSMSFEGEQRERER